MTVIVVQTIWVVSFILRVGNAATDHKIRQGFLDCHNFMRSQLALGKFRNQPPAADMTLMDYDIELEKRSILWNQQCIVGHDSSEHRLVQLDNYRKVFPEIGQNWAGSTFGILKYSCEGWWNEHLNYVYSNSTKIDPKLMVGHYTQMAWAKSTLVGCAVAYNCKEKKQYGEHAVCNYAAAGNYVGHKPYKNGTACSQCPDGFKMCMNKALCARPDQCTRSGVKCVCALSCQNGGVLNKTKCSCKCTTNYFGENCQNKCEDSNEYCGLEYDTDCTDVYWMKNCRKRCSKCVKDEPFKTKAFGDVKSRINANWENLNDTKTTKIQN